MGNAKKWLIREYDFLIREGWMDGAQSVNKYSKTNVFRKKNIVKRQSRVNQLFCRGHLTGLFFLSIVASFFMQIGRTKVD